MLSAAGRYLDVTYPASAQPGELKLAVKYTIWIPDGVSNIKGVIVHQHGCGAPANKAGETAAYDLHWQALAQKWGFALLGPYYQQIGDANCDWWSNPRNGSDKAFLRALSEFAAKAKHPELATAPWCLWGHSGGGTWSGGMQSLYPERIIAIYFKSGSVAVTPETPAAAYGIPMMCNPGGKEKDDKRFGSSYTRLEAMYQAYRAKGAPIAFAPNPQTSHECGDARYLAIPFFDACIRLRLSAKGILKPVKTNGESDWMPDQRVASAFREYVKTGTVSDSTPPPAPTALKAVRSGDSSVEITWQAQADFESGISAFIIQRDGKDLARLPEKPAGRFGKPLFQQMSYHDTPEAPIPQLRYIDKSPEDSGRHTYRVITVNSSGLKSKPSKGTSLR
jgi:hypothetical protein